MPEKEKPLKANLMLKFEKPHECQVVRNIDHITDAMIQTKHNLHLMIVDMEKLREHFKFIHDVQMEKLQRKSCWEAKQCIPQQKMTKKTTTKKAVLASQAQSKRSRTTR